MVAGDQGPLDRRAGHRVVPDHRVQRQQALHDAGPQARRGPAAVAFQAELALQRPDDRLGALARPVREVPRLLVVFPGRAGQVQAQTGEELLEVVPGEALVRDDRGAAAGPAGRLRGEQLLDSLAFARQLGADWVLSNALELTLVTPAASSGLRR